jgi:pimeloyl-ACP methyl ester carboxylesterase
MCEQASGALTHHEGDLGDVRLHYVTAGSGDPVVLVHGWPKTWFEWRYVIPILAEKYTVIAPDMRGLGDSSRPERGYDKRTVSEDIWRLVHEVLGYESWFLAGRDWGAPTAYSLAAGHPDSVRRLACIEATPKHAEQPWSPDWWHLFFQVQALPEQLVEGREEVLLRWFYDQLGHPSYSTSDEEMAEYMRTWGRPETISAGFDYYRALPQDFIDNTELGRTAKLPMPVLAVQSTGPIRLLGPEPVTTTNQIAASLGHLADDVTAAFLEDVGHWVSEEEPERLAAVLLDFFSAGD